MFDDVVKLFAMGLLDTFPSEVQAKYLAGLMEFFLGKNHRRSFKWKDFQDFIFVFVISKK